MSENKEQNKQKEFIDSLVKDNPATKAFQKLHREPLEINVYRHTSAIEALETELGFIEGAVAQTKNSEEVKQLEERKGKVNTQLATLEKDKIEGVLTTLTYRDINDIKAAVTEAVLHFRDYNFDQDVVIARVVAEERYMTVFCALKRTENHTQRYFKTLEDIAQIDDVTIFDLYDKWEKHFVLTEDELKN